MIQIVAPGFGGSMHEADNPNAPKKRDIMTSRFLVLPLIRKKFIHAETLNRLKNEVRTNN